VSCGHHDIIRATRALFIGTPKGLNHFHDLYQNAQAQAHWQAFRYTTEEGGNVSPEEIESASSEQDKRTYQQEFQASFENLSHGVVYYAFSRSDNLRDARWRALLVPGFQTWTR
jgi:hypothetical protein